MSSKLVYCLLILGIFVIFLQGFAFAEKIPAISPAKLVKNLTESITVNTTDMTILQPVTKLDITKETGLLSSKKNRIDVGSPDEVTPVSEMASVGIIDTLELTEDEIESGPYQNSEWITIGGSAGHGNIPIFGNSDNYEFMSDGRGLSADIKPGKTEHFILPLAVNQDAHIRYLKIVDQLDPYDENPAIRISAIEVYNGYERVALFNPQWIHYNEQIHYVDLGEYYQFDKGLQIDVSVHSDEEVNHNLYYITGYGARIEW